MTVMKAKPREPVVYHRLVAMEAMPVELELISALQEIHERIAEGGELGALLDDVCGAIGRILGADRVHLALKGTDSNVFGRIDHEWCSCPEINRTLGGMLPSEQEDDVVLDLVATPPPLAVIDPLNNPKLAAGPRQLFEAMQVKSSLAGRLQFQSRVLGLLCVHQCDRVRHWTRQEATFLSVVLGLLGLAIANNRMIQSMQAQHQEMVSLHFRLEESHQQLEAQVAERTAQLREANETLTAMLDELRQLDQLKSGFLDTVSHELRTPIHFITGFGSLLNDGMYGELPEKAQGAVSKIMVGAERLMVLVDDLLDQSRLERGKLSVKAQAVDYAALLRRMVEDFQPLVSAKGQCLTLDFPEAMPPLYADPERTHQVLRNLLSNAVKFTPERGEIRLTVSREGDMLKTVVADNGIGIPKEAQAQIFERFYQVDHGPTRSYGGTGLGLAIVKALVAAMSGRLSLESAPGQGSRFIVELPCLSSSEGA